MQTVALVEPKISLLGGIKVKKVSQQRAFRTPRCDIQRGLQHRLPNLPPYIARNQGKQIPSFDFESRFFNHDQIKGEHHHDR